MVKRLLTAGIGIAFLIFVLAFNYVFPFIMNICLAVICALAVSEVFTAMNIYKAYCIVIPSIIFSVMIPLFGISIVSQISLYLFTVIIFAVMILKHKAFSFKDISATYTMTIIITFSLSTIVMIRDLHEDVGIFYVTLALAIPWMSDVGAFFVGKCMGKRKLCPQISPNKTVEGAIGGVVISTISIILIAILFKNFWFNVPLEINYMYLIIMSVIGSIMSILGDLCFSFVKRSCHVKDFGNAFPGHGGFLDRFDSVVMAAPFVYLFTLYLPLVS